MASSQSSSGYYSCERREADTERNARAQLEEAGHKRICGFDERALRDSTQQRAGVGASDKRRRHQSQSKPEKIILKTGITSHGKK